MHHSFNDKTRSPFGRLHGGADSRNVSASVHFNAKSAAWTAARAALAAASLLAPMCSMTGFPVGITQAGRSASVQFCARHLAHVLDIQVHIRDILVFNARVHIDATL